MDTSEAYAAIPIPEFIIGSRASLMIALCAGCHAKLHRTKVVLTEFPRYCWNCGESSTPKATNRRTSISAFANQRLRVCH
jgi:predicted amidophosphoribosyltransferase